MPGDGAQRSSTDECRETERSGARPMNAATRADLRRPDGTPVRALVVDDEPTLAELLSMALRYEGWDVDHALSGHAAVRAAKALDPDVIVLDVMLPDLSCIDVLRRV